MTLTTAQVVEVFESATEENKADSMRVGQVVHLPAEGEVWVTGDMHDHRRNFEKLLQAADLVNNPDRHLVLHEVIHGEHFDENRAEGSWEILYRVALLKCDYPSQIHFLLANHDLAQIYGEGIMKAGLSVCEAFNAGVKRDFGGDRYKVQVAITEFLLSFPLAIKTRNGLWISHSLPSEDQIPEYDYSVFERELVPADYKRRTGPAYQLVWGRRQTPEGAAGFADKVGAQLIITGHQPQDSGYAVNGDRHLIIASDHNQGVFVALSLSEPYTMETMLGQIFKFVALDLPPADEAADKSAPSSEETSIDPPPAEAPGAAIKEAPAPTDTPPGLANAGEAPNEASSIEARPSDVWSTEPTADPVPIPDAPHEASAAEIPAAAIANRIIRHPLLTAAFAEAATVGRVEVKEIRLAADQATGTHFHPGPVVGLVTQGAILFQVDGEPPRTIAAGEAFYEPAGARILHFDATDAPATFVAFYLLQDESQPLIEMLSDA